MGELHATPTPLKKYGWICLPPGASVRPSDDDDVRPHRSAKSTKNGPSETDLANSIAGRGVPKKGHFLDLTQIRQSM